jgi:hypothetical protein
MHHSAAALVQTCDNVFEGPGTLRVRWNLISETLRVNELNVSGSRRWSWDGGLKDEEL